MFADFLIIFCCLLGCAIFGRMIFHALWRRRFFFVFPRTAAGSDGGFPWFLLLPAAFGILSQHLRPDLVPKIEATGIYDYKEDKLGFIVALFLSVVFFLVFLIFGLIMLESALERALDVMIFAPDSRRVYDAM